MADQRPFRFRLPWLLAPTPVPSSSSTTTAPRPTAESDASRQTRGSATRPPFRPAGVAQPPRPSTQPPPPQSRTESSHPPPSPSRTKPTSPPPKTPQGGAQPSQPPPPKTPQGGAQPSQPPPLRPKATSPPAAPSTPQAGAEPQGTRQSPPPVTTGSSTSSPPKKSGSPSLPSTLTQVPSPPSPVTKPPQTSPPITKIPSPSKNTQLPSTSKDTQLPSPSRAATLSQPSKPKPTQPSSPPQLNSEPKPTTTENSPASPSQEKSTNFITTAWEKLTQHEPKETVKKEKVIKESETIEGSATKPQSKLMIPDKEEHPINPAQKTFPGTPRKLDELKAVPRSSDSDKPTREETDNGLPNNNSKQKEIRGIPQLPSVSSLKNSPVNKPSTTSQPSPTPEIIQTKDTLTVSDTHPSSLHNPNPDLSIPNRHNPHKPSMSGEDKTLPSHRDIKDGISKVVNTLGIGGQGKIQSPLTLNGDNKPVSVITLAGENRGASMTLGSESTGRREKSIHIHRGYRINPDECPDTATTDGEESSRLHNNKSSKSEDDDDVENNEAYINSNVQGINNSLVFNSSVSVRNPGVQYTLSRNRPREIRGTRDEPGRYEVNRGESSVTSAKKLAYTPAVRRRCLRGLFMESSDSELENPDKPRRHGCRYGGCKEDDKNIDVL